MRRSLPPSLPPSHTPSLHSLHTPSLPPTRTQSRAAQVEWPSDLLSVLQWARLFQVTSLVASALLLVSCLFRPGSSFHDVRLLPFGFRVSGFGSSCPLTTIRSFFPTWLVPSARVVHRPVDIFHFGTEQDLLCILRLPTQKIRVNMLLQAVNQGEHSVNHDRFSHVPRLDWLAK